MTVEWVPSSLDAVKTGDTVRLEHGDGSWLLGTVQAIDNIPGVATNVAWRSNHAWRELGWSVASPAGVY